MSNSQHDAFDRLKNRSRAKVPARSKSLTDSSNDSKTEFSHSVLNELSQDSVPESEPSRKIPEREAIRRTIRIEPDVDEGLEVLCSRAKITRETFLEAAYLSCTQDPDLMASVLAEAQQRYRQRKQAGEQRKFNTMSRKYK
jgi:hypothetical protein